jgi:hypothetical protein
MHAQNHQQQSKYTLADLERVIQNSSGGERLGGAEARKPAELDCPGTSVVLTLERRSYQALEHDTASSSLRGCLLGLLVLGCLQGGCFFDSCLLRALLHLAFVPREQVCAV